MRGAQIDPFLCLLSTFSLYALLRHLLLGPAWQWYFAGAVAGGLGVVTKGVGVLPLLLLARAVGRGTAAGRQAPVPEIKPIVVLAR